MTTPEANAADVQEQELAVTDEPEPIAGDLPLEAAEADVAEQRMEVGLDEEEPSIG
jgi:hypothetical protein